MEQRTTEIPPEYYEISRLMDDYKLAICQNFRTNQALLVQQLEEKARKLKQSIAFYKKQTSSQNIQKLISKKRHEKQAQRLQLEVQWRNLTQKYKKLQQQQKKIKQQNRQNKFDLQNLQNKIQTLKVENIELDKRIIKLKQQLNNQPFITQVNNTSYISPYKCCKNDKISLQYSLPKSKPKLTKLSSKETTNFRLKLQNNKKILKLDNKENNKLKDQNFDFYLKQKKMKFQQQNNNIFKEQYANIKDMGISALYSSVDNRANGNLKNYSKLNKDKKWQQLMHYLDRPQVRDKIFDLLRK